MITGRGALAAAAAFACAAASAGVAWATAATADGSRVVVPLKEQDSSGVRGTATLTRTDETVRVVVKLNKPAPGSLPAHVHIGPCSVAPNLNVRESLTNVVRGRSTTPLTTTWTVLRARKHSIHVHALDYRVIACGDIPR